jgi:RNA polymerase sigma-B factor
MVESMSASPAPPPERTRTEEETIQLIAMVQRYRDEDARERLVRAHTPLVEKVARRFLDTGEPLEDLMQEGFLGLLTAIDLFDTNYSVKFTTYAHHLITGQMRHYLRDKGTIIREPAWSQDLRRTIKKAAAELASRLQREPTTAELAEACNLTEEAVSEVLAAEQVAKVVSLDGFTEDDAPAVDPDKIRSLKHTSFQLPLEDRIVLEEIVSNLKSIEQRVVQDFFFRDLTQTEIARSLGVSCNYVSHLLKSSLKKLGKSIAFTELQERQLRKRTAVTTDYEEEISVVDRVTGLYTAGYYERRMDEEIARSRTMGYELSSVYLACEDLSDAQARYGVEWTERTLSSIAQIIKGSIRRCDIAAHFGDGTFAIILPHTGEGARVVLDRLLSTLTNTDMGRGVTLHFRGVALLVPTDGSSARDLNGRAGATLSAPLAVA